MAVFVPSGTDDSARASDASLMFRVADGDASALAEVYDRHAGGVYALALRVLGEQGDAEDVVQEVFSQAWRFAARYDPSRGSLAAWLLVMTRTRAIDRLRGRKARPDRNPVADETILARVPAVASDPSSALSAAEDAVRVRRALADLPMLQRIAIELAYFEGLTQQEIAERLEQPLGTVKTRIRLGLLRLRDALAAAGA